MSLNYPNDIYFCDLLPELARQYEREKFNDSLNISIRNVKFGENNRYPNDSATFYKSSKCYAVFESVVAIQQIRTDRNEEIIFVGGDQEENHNSINNGETSIAKELNAHLITEKHTISNHNNTSFLSTKRLNSEFPQLITDIEELLNLENEERLVNVHKQLDDSNNIYLHVKLPKTKQTSRSILFELAGLMYHFSKNEENEEEEEKIRIVGRIRFPFVHFGEIRIKLTSTVKSTKNIHFFNCFGSLNGLIEGISCKEAENDDNFESDKFFRSIDSLTIQNFKEEDSTTPKNGVKNEISEPDELIHQIHTGMLHIIQNRMNLRKNDKLEDILMTPLPYLGVDSLRKAEFEYYLTEKWPKCSELGDAFLLKTQTIKDAAKLLSTVVKFEEMDSDEELQTKKETPISLFTYSTPLSSQQKRLLFISEISENFSEFNEIVRIRFTTSKMTIESISDFLKKSLNLLILRHSILRTEYHESCQFLHSATECFVVPTSSKYEDTPPDKKLKRIVSLSCYIEKNILVLVFNHIAIDGKSLSIFYKDFQFLCEYPNFELPKSPDPQYYNYCQEPENHPYSESYWEKVLVDEHNNDVELFPTDFPRINELSGLERTETYRVPQKISEKIDVLCKKYQMSKFEFFVSFLQIVFQNVFGTSSFNLGYAVDLRTYKFSKTMGCFTNLLPLQSSKLEDFSEMSDFLDDVQKKIQDGREHGRVPYEKIVKIAMQNSVEDGNWNRELFQVLVVSDNVEELKIDKLDIGMELKSQKQKPKTVRFKDEHMKMTVLPSEYNHDAIRNTAKYDQTWFLRTSINSENEALNGTENESNEEMEIEVQYDESLYKPSTIRFLIHYLLRLFNQDDMISDFQQCGSVQLSDYPKAIIPQMVDRLRMCYMDKKETISFSIIDSFSQNLGRLLLAKSFCLYGQLSSDSPLLIRLKRSPLLIKTIFATWIAGLYPIPVHTDLNDAVVGKIMKQIGTQLIVLEEETVKNIPFSRSRLFNRSSMFDLAYVTCTSGSTGEPKLVGTAFEGHSNLAVQYTKTFQLSERDVICQVVDPSFDIFFADITKCSMNNCCLLLCRDQICSSSELKQSTNAYIMPSFLSRLPSLNHISNLKTLQYGGESLSFQVIQNILSESPKIRIWQEFGLTEQTVYTARNRIKANCKHEMRHIGEAYDNLKLTVWDGQGNNAPEICLKGQLVLEGCGLMRGYFGIDKSIVNVDEVPKFVSGDEVSVDENGKINFIGRKDSQIKIRGYRIDLFEIESIAMSSKKLKNCICIGVNNQIILFYIGNITPIDLKMFLEKELVAYKVPSEIVSLEQFPITRTGKIDRSRLKKSFRESVVSKDIQENVNYVENKNIDLLKEYLEKYSDAKIAFYDDDIFAAGVDSVAIMLTIQNMRRNGVELDAKSFFKLRTLNRISSNIENDGKAENVNEVVKISDNRKTREDRQLFIELNHIQQRILFLSRFLESSIIFRLKFSLPIPSTDNQTLVISVNLVIVGNYLLRSQISRQGDYRFVLLSATECFHRIDYETISKKERNESGFEVKVWLENNELKLSIHHIHCDARSLQILKTQLITAIENYRTKINFENTFSLRESHCSPESLKPDSPVRILFSEFNPGSKMSKYLKSISPSDISGDYQPIPVNHLIFYFYAQSIFEIFFSFDGKSDVEKNSNSTIPIAVTVANRQSENWNTVSMFANTLPIYFNPEHSSIESISSKISEINSNGNIPLKDLVSKTGPFSDFAINFHNSDEVDSENGGENEYSQFPLTLTYYQKTGTFIFGFDSKYIELGKVEKLSKSLHRKLVLPEKETNSPEDTVLEIFRGVLSTKCDMNTNFFHSGGHSLTAMKLIDQINEEMNLDLPIKTLFENPTVEDMIKVIARLKNTKIGKVEVLESILKSEDKKELPSELYKFPLCTQQLQMFYLSQLTSDSTEYQLPFIQPFPDSISVHQIHQSLLKTIQYQNIFRTIFRICKKTGEPYQQVVSITESFLACNIETVADSQLHERVRELCKEPIEVIDERNIETTNSKSLIRAVFLKSSKKNVAFLHLHHLISDARSTQITNNLMKEYLTSSNQVNVKRPPEASTYAYYCKNENDKLESSNSSSIDEDYMNNICEAVQKPLKPTKLSQCSCDFIEFPSSHVSNSWSDTPFSIFLNAVSTTLCEFFNISSINISFPILNRKEKTANICGYFLNNLIIKMPTTPKDFHSILQSNLPYTNIVNRVRAKCGNNHPISEVYLNCRYDLEYDETDEEELLNLIPIKLHFPIEIDVDLLKNVFRITMRSNIIEKNDVRMLLGKIKTLAVEQNEINSIENHHSLENAKNTVIKCDSGSQKDSPERKTDGRGLDLDNDDIKSSSRVSRKQKTDDFQILESCSGLNSMSKICSTTTAIDLQQNSRQVRESKNSRKTPNPTKIDFNNVILGARHDIPNHSLPKLIFAFFQSGSYSSSMMFASEGCDPIKNRSYQKSWLSLISESKSIHNSVLVCRGTMIRSDDLIAVISSKSIDTTLLCLSVQLTGGAYLPVDEISPESTIVEKLKASGAIGYISSQNHTCLNKTAFTRFKQRQNKNSSLRVVAGSSPFDMSYVITTSGTTGTPKSVCISGYSVSNLAVSSTVTMNCSSTSNVFQFTNFVFDNSVLEVVMTVSNQAKLIYEEPSPSGEVYFDSSSFEKLIKSPGISHCLLFPSLVQSMEIARIEHLAYWIVGGERLSQPLLTSSLQSSCHVIQNYGPTETTAFAVSRRMRIGDKSTNVGIPAYNTIAFLNQNELYIRGKGMMRGYWGVDTQKTIKTENEKKWYGSGDICELSKDANGMRCIVFKGRMDSQIKIRGFRVELQEIEKSIESHPEVSICKTVFDSKNLNIFAFFTSKSHISAVNIRTFCSTKLENYKIPSFFENLEQFPLTTNSKIDMEKLRKLTMQGNENIEQIDEKPRNNMTAEKISKIWESLLNLEHPLPRDSSSHFFLIGGHSLLLIRLRHMIQTELGIFLNVPDLLNNLKFSDLVSFIENETDRIIHSEKLLKTTNEHRKHQEVFVFFPALYGGCTTYLKLGNLVKKLKSQSRVLYLEEEFGDSVEEVAEKYKKQINLNCTEKTNFIFIGASAAGTISFATSLIYTFDENFTIDVVLIDSGTYWNLIEKLSYDQHEKEITENLKTYTDDEETIRRFIESSWGTLQILKKYDPLNSSQSESSAKIHVLSIDGSSLGWNKLVDSFRNLRLTIHKIDGDHYTMLQDEQHVQTILNILTKLTNS